MADDPRARRAGDDGRVVVVHRDGAHRHAGGAGGVPAGGILPVRAAAARGVRPRVDARRADVASSSARGSSASTCAASRPADALPGGWPHPRVARPRLRRATWATCRARRTLREDVRRVLPSARSVIVTGTALQHRPALLGRDRRTRRRRSSHATRGARTTTTSSAGGSTRCWTGCAPSTARRSRRAPTSTPGRCRSGRYAERAGLGWIGKNGCLINPDLGSWLFLSEIVCSLPLAPDEPGARPVRDVHALPRGVSDRRARRAARARRHAVPLVPDDRAAARRFPEPLRAAVGTHVFGCDICQDVCPWNQAAATSDDPAWQPRAALDRPRLVDLWRRSDEELDGLIRGSAMSRARRRRACAGTSRSRSATAATPSRAGAATTRPPAAPSRSGCGARRWPGREHGRRAGADRPQPELEWPPTGGRRRSFRKGLT